MSTAALGGSGRDTEPRSRLGQGAMKLESIVLVFQSWKKVVEGLRLTLAGEVVYRGEVNRTAGIEAIAELTESQGTR